MKSNLLALLEELREVVEEEALKDEEEHPDIAHAVCRHLICGARDGYRFLAHAGVILHEFSASQARIFDNIKDYTIREESKDSNALH